MDNSYSPTIEEIKTLQKQIELTDIQANSLLIKHNGNLLEATFEAFNVNDVNNVNDDTNNDTLLNNFRLHTKEEEVDMNMQDYFKTYRHILKEKDKIFETTVSNNFNVDNMVKYQYITFTNKTNTFYRRKINTTKELMLHNTIEKFLRTHLIENDDNDDNDDNDNNQTQNNKLTCKYLGKHSRSMYKKWNFDKPGIFYLSNQCIHLSKTQSEKYNEYENKLATRFLRKAEYFNENNILIGACVIVDKWF